MSARQHRSYDRESGLNRTKRDSKFERKPKPKQQIDSSEDEHEVDSSAEELAQATFRDDSIRQTRQVKDRRSTRGQAKQPKPEAQEADNEDIEEVKQPVIKTASHFSFLVAMARQITPQPIVYPSVSEYIPDTGNMFECIFFITRAVSDNLKLFEANGDYNSLAIYLYYSHVVYYHLLRVRNDSGQLTRLERRSLRLYESVGKPESWPIATPLIGFVQALGYVEVPDKMFSLIVPKLPAVSGLTAKKGLTNLHSVHGLGRMPIPPAYQEFLRRFGAGRTSYDDETEHYRPADTPFDSSSPDDATFVGITASTATSNDFQALSMNQTWATPAETKESVGQFSMPARLVKIKRWGIPKIGDESELNSLEQFLFGSGEHLEWMSKLLKASDAINKFFPGSSNLGAIPTLTTMHTFVSTEYEASVQLTPSADKWNYPRKQWRVSYKSNLYGTEDNVLTQAAVAVSVNSTLHATTHIPALSNYFSNGRTGPYFHNPTNERSVPIPQSEGLANQDPTRRIEELIIGAMYKAQGE